MSKVNISSYIPLEHVNFDITKTLLEVARNQDRLKAEGILTSVMIYINAIDYIATHLVIHLQKILYITTYRASDARIFLEEPKKEVSEPLGKLIYLLNNFNFPDKNNFLDKLKDFNKLRTKYVHRLMRLDPADISTNKIDKELNELCDTAEDIIENYDSIRLGIIKTWEDYKNKERNIQSQNPIQKETLPE